MLLFPSTKNLFWLKRQETSQQSSQMQILQSNTSIFAVLYLLKPDSRAGSASSSISALSAIEETFLLI